MRRAHVFVTTALLGGVAWALAGRGLVNYDTLYALVWGREIAHGRRPDLELSLAPTPHPLANAAGAVASLFGDGTDLTLIGAFAALGALGWVTYQLGSEWFGRAAGVLAAAIILTRRPVLDFGARAYVDVPYLVLVLGALLVETRRRRAGAPVLGLLAVAGLIRPEAWLLTAAYVVWLRLGGPLDARLWALAATGPALWAFSDLVLTGDALHSLTGTRDNAERLQRITGLGAVPGTVPRRIGEIVREPVLVGAAGGALLALWRLRERALPGAVTGVVALGAFCVLAASGLPILGRYLLLPATILVLFCAGGALGWTALPRGDPWRRRWAWFGALVLALLLAFTPAQADRITALRDALRRQSEIQDDLHALRGSLCAPVAVPNHRPVPLLALWLDTAPSAIVVAQERRPDHGSYALPASPAVARDYILDPRDVDQGIPAAPVGFTRAASNASWRIFRRC